MFIQGILLDCFIALGCAVFFFNLERVFDYIFQQSLYHTYWTEISDIEPRVDGRKSVQEIVSARAYLISEDNGTERVVSVGDLGSVAFFFNRKISHIQEMTRGAMITLLIITIGAVSFKISHLLENSPSQEIGFIETKWYSIAILLGILVTIIVTYWEKKKFFAPIMKSPNSDL